MVRMQQRWDISDDFVQYHRQRRVAANVEALLQRCTWLLQIDALQRLQEPSRDHRILGSMMSGIDEIEFETHRQTCTGNVVMNERTDRFRIGEASIALPVAGVFEVGPDGRIVLWRDYFDMKTFTDQMAAITPPA